MPQQGPHQGAALHTIILRTVFSITDVANMLEVTRRTVYLWIDKPVLPIQVIENVGNAIGVDFYATMPEVFGHGRPVRPMKKRDNTPPDMAEYWKSKFLKATQEIDTLKAKIAKKE
jgi:hypothetical protein